MEDGLVGVLGIEREQRVVMSGRGCYLLLRRRAFRCSVLGQRRLAAWARIRRLTLRPWSDETHFIRAERDTSLRLVFAILQQLSLSGVVFDLLFPPHLRLEDRFQAAVGNVDGIFVRVIRWQVDAREVPADRVPILLEQVVESIEFVLHQVGHIYSSVSAMRLEVCVAREPDVGAAEIVTGRCMFHDGEVQTVLCHRYKLELACCVRELSSTTIWIPTTFLIVAVVHRLSNGAASPVDNLDELDNGVPVADGLICKIDYGVPRGVLEVRLQLLEPADEMVIIHDTLRSFVEGVCFSPVVGALSV